MYNYFPTFFEIKHKSSVSSGSQNLFNMLTRVKNFPDKKVSKIAVEVVRRNSFFAHPENVILGMLASPDSRIREKGITHILCLREKTKSTTIRKFVVPQVDIKAKCFHEISDLNDDNLEEPPLTRNLSFNELKSISEAPLILKHPCHNQNVERHVKMVTEASSSVFTFNRRDGLIRQKVKSRKLIKTFENKGQFRTGVL